MQTLDSFVATAQLADRRALAASARAARRTAPARPGTSAPRERVVLRPAAAADAAALTRLAQLDGAPRPSGDLLVAELDGRIAAAVPVGGGRAIADPFLPTADLVELLRARAGALGAGTPAGRLQRLRPRLRHLRLAA